MWWSCNEKLLWNSYFYLWNGMVVLKVAHFALVLLLYFMMDFILIWLVAELCTDINILAKFGIPVPFPVGAMATYIIPTLGGCIILSNHNCCFKLSLRLCGSPERISLCLGVIVIFYDGFYFNFAGTCSTLTSTSLSSLVFLCLFLLEPWPLILSPLWEDVLFWVTIIVVLSFI